MVVHRMHRLVHMHLCIYVCIMYVYRYVSMYELCVCMYVRTYVCTYVCVCTYTRMYGCMHDMDHMGRLVVGGLVDLIHPPLHEFGIGLHQLDPRHQRRCLVSALAAV